jgi:tetratricopeptide (TPR) repeat protein
MDTKKFIIKGRHLKAMMPKQVMAMLMILLFSSAAMAQTFTMAKKCRETNGAAKVLLQEKKYQEALDAFVAMEKSCTTKDAKEATAVGKAEAYNGLGKYEEAITASDAALKVTKNKSLVGYFQKGIAQNKLGQFDASKESLSKVIALTEKNQDTKSRASNYALLSILNYRQLGNTDSAFFYLDKAMGMDPANTDFVIQKGDMLVDQKDYDGGFAQYDKAVEMGRTDMDMYVIRSNARMKMVQQKYNTTNTQELRSKMTTTEKEQVCTELKKAISMGLKDMKQDMFASLVCK